VKNQGNFLRIPYDTANGYPVSCDGVDYRVDHIDIYQPSLHRYDGETAPAELLAYHTSSHGDNLIISIPIIVGNTNGRQSSEIMNEIFKNLPTSTSTTKTINTITNFNLGNLVPKEGFFIYTGKNLLTPYTGIYKYIVYHVKDGITISRDVLANLNVASKNTSISPSQTIAAVNMPNTLYFYNKEAIDNRMATMTKKHFTNRVIDNIYELKNFILRYKKYTDRGFKIFIDENEIKITFIEKILNLLHILFNIDINTTNYITSQKYNNYKASSMIYSFYIKYFYLNEQIMESVYHPNNIHRLLNMNINLDDI
jgi:hypothetical protein